MSDHDQSCLVEKLSHYVDLDDTARTHLASLEETERNYRRHQEVFSVGDASERMFVVKKGWFYSYADMPDGRRQIVRIMLPGDILGMPDIAFTKATCNVRASEDGCLCPFPKRRMDVIFRESPALSALLFTIANRELAVMIDTLQALGRMSARERLAYLFLDLLARLKITNRTMTNTIRMPMNQHEIGDALGLTHTYVSKTLIDMEDDGLISRASGELTLIKERKLTELVDFENRYDDMDTSWFPKS